jgi:hypothetical protein
MHEIPNLPFPSLQPAEPTSEQAAQARPAPDTRDTAQPARLDGED